MKKLIEEIYVSVDVEADGPIPQRNSMSSLGAVIAGYRLQDGTHVAVDPSNEDDRFYVQFKPISDNWDPAAAAVGLVVGFDATQVDLTGELKRQFLIDHGTTPEDGMEAFTAWVCARVEHYGAARGPVMLGFPIVYDWMWVYWYMIAFTEAGSPFGHSKAYDIKTAYAVKGGASIAHSIKRRMPKFLMSKLPHTHMAVDDAAEQGQLAFNIMNWDGSR